MLGSTDLIGNPVEIIDKIGTGAYHLVNEPWKNFVVGLGKGTFSFGKAIVSAGTGFVSKTTGSLFNITKKITGEDEVERKPIENIGEGIVKGVGGGLGEIVYGLAGVVTKPIQGAKKGGTKGFFKGVGKGIIGGIVIPITATLKFTSVFTEGISNQTWWYPKYGRFR